MRRIGQITIVSHDSTPSTGQRSTASREVSHMADSAGVGQPRQSMVSGSGPRRLPVSRARIAVTSSESSSKSNTSKFS